MPILGQPFEDWVTKQINVRQESLGKYASISSKDLQYYTTKTPWIRLASSVNLKNSNSDNGVLEKLISNGLTENQVGGDNLAKNFILQGGALSVRVGSNGEIISNGLNSGLNDGSSIFKGAYGWGGTGERGFVPMPGITNVDVQYQNNGALSKATINIKCFNRRQFQLIDVLYLRPGYSLLLEFGHSVYLDNDKNLTSFDKFSTEPLRTLLNPGGKNQYDIYRQIAKARKEYDGNYEAVYGKITTFNWQFNPDGSYDCQVSLIGMGDVIESLKMNNSLNVKTSNIAPFDISIKSIIQKIILDSSTDPIVASRDKSILNKILFDLYQRSDFSLLRNPIYPIFLPDFPNIPSKSKPFSSSEEFKLETLEIKNSLLMVNGVSGVSKGIDSQSKQSYITFGALMAIVQSRLLLYNHVGDKSIPITTFDIDFNNLEKDENYILTFPGSFSSNPDICLIPYSNTAPPISNLNIPTSEVNDALSISSFNKTNYAGRLTSIFINISYIVGLIEELPKTEDNSISLLSFLKEIIKGITQSLGGINQILIQTTEDGEIRFVEDIPQNLNLGIPQKDFARFKAFGVESGKGSFIKDIKLTADLGSDFAAMISIGAQNNGNQQSGNATAFSNYNAGLEDRIIPTKISYSPETKNVDEEEEEKINIESNFEKITKNPNNLLLSIYNNKKFIGENISTLQSLNTTHAKLIIGKLSQPSIDQQIQSPFFLPFNLSLEIEGLSGMKLYQKFKISDEVLPPSYEKDGVEIQVKGINHSVNTTAWTTKLDTLSVPAFKTQNIVQSDPYPLGSESRTTIGDRSYVATDYKGTLQDLIGSEESNNNYNIVVGGIIDIALTTRTVLENAKLYNEGTVPSGSGKAMGRYQIQYATWKDTMTDVNLVFNEANQDRAYEKLLQRRGLSSYKSNTLSIEDFGTNLSREWASLPKDSSDVSYYAGVSTNKALTSWDNVIQAIKNTYG